MDPCIVHQPYYTLAIFFLHAVVVSAIYYDASSYGYDYLWPLLLTWLNFNPSIDK